MKIFTFYFREHIIIYNGIEGFYLNFTEKSKWAMSTNHWTLRTTQKLEKLQRS